jgi:serine/threonine-protein kinase
MLPEAVLRHRRTITLALSGVAALATVAAIALHRNPPPPIDAGELPRVAAPPLSHAPPPSPTVTPLPAPAPEMIQLSITVAPPAAQLSIDGQPVPSNPFLGRFAKDPAMHLVRASAPGFLPKERLVSFADNVFVDLNLVARPAAPTPPPPRREPPRRAIESRPVVVTPAPAPAAPPPPVAAPARPTEISARPEPRRRAIDSNNPYGDDK